ncbi:MAG: group 1 truncated hemoglobin [Actinomycetota bacterium]|nr:group 1 truncated hemoglobin [Actinomycetota bacterium]
MTEATPAPETTSIYDTIGGAPAVSATVDRFYERLLADSATAGFFEGYDVGRIKGHQRAFIAAALDGPDRYAGRGMRDAHAGLEISDADFDAVVAHLVATLTELGVDEAVIGQIGGALAPLRSEIVTVAPPQTT